MRKQLLGGFQCDSVINKCFTSFRNQTEKMKRKKENMADARHSCGWGNEDQITSLSSNPEAIECEIHKMNRA